MRGAQPDAVCPRCNHHQPPSDTPLAHCAQCGLTFQPKEIFVRSRRPTRELDEPPVFDAALVIAPPASLTIDDTADELVYTWSDHPSLFRVAMLASVALGLVLWVSSAALNDKIGGTLTLAVIALAGLFQSRPSIKLRVAKHHLRSGRGLWLFSDLARVELIGRRLFAITREDKRQLILEVREVEIGAYLQNTFTKRLALEPVGGFVPPHEP